MNLQLFCKKNYINHLPNSMTAVFRNEKGNQLLSFLQSTLVNLIRQNCAKQKKCNKDQRSITPLKVLTYAIIFFLFLSFHLTDVLNWVIFLLELLQ